MARRRIAYRKRRQNRLSMFMVSVVVVIILIVASVRGMEMQDKLDAYTARQEELQKQIDKEQQRSEEIEEYRKYTQTKKFAEEVAKDKLGLVYDDEIVFKQEE